MKFDVENFKNKELNEVFHILVQDLDGDFDRFRFAALVGDLAPHLKVEYQRIKIINQTSAFDDIYIANSLDETKRITALENTIRKIRNSTGMVDNWADYIVISFAWALGWQVTPIKPSDKTEQVSDEYLPDKVFTVSDIAEFSENGILSIPKGFTEIEKKVFQGNKEIISLILPDGMRKIDKYAFDGCENLKSVVMSDTVTEIGESAFCMCFSLEKIKFSRSLEVIGDTAFWKCNNLKQIALSDKLTKIGHAAFMECSALESVSLSEGLTVIADSAFRNCTSLKEINIPESVRTVERLAFGGCRSLSNICLSEKVSQIDRTSFGMSTSNLTVVCKPGSYAQKYCAQHNIKTK